VPVDYEFGSAMALANGDDELILIFEDPDVGVVELDRVEWGDGGDWPDSSGRSLSLDPGSTNTTDNDDGTNWCHGSTTYGDGDVGTPGAENDPC